MARPYVMGPSVNARGVDRKRYASEVYHGTRESLYAPAVKLDTGQLGTMSDQLRIAIAKRLYALARIGRDRARKAAPKKTGALRAGIYVTAPASQAQMKTLTGGGTVALSAMAGVTAAYYASINAAAKRNGVEVPGSARDIEETGGSRYVTHRTQRLKKNIKAIDFAEDLLSPDTDLDEVDMDSLSNHYAAVNTMLPFNPIGNTRKDSFFVGLGSAVFYSAWVEYGNSKRKGTPFFTPAADWLVKESAKAVAQEIMAFKPKQVGARKVKTVK